MQYLGFAHTLCVCAEFGCFHKTTTSFLQNLNLKWVLFSMLFLQRKYSSLYQEEELKLCIIDQKPLLRYEHICHDNTAKYVAVVAVYFERYTFEWIFCMSAAANILYFDIAKYETDTFFPWNFTLLSALEYSSFNCGIYLEVHMEKYVIPQIWN